MIIGIAHSMICTLEFWINKMKLLYFGLMYTLYRIAETVNKGETAYNNYIAVAISTLLIFLNFVIIIELFLHELLITQSRSLYWAIVISFFLSNLYLFTKYKQKIISHYEKEGSKRRRLRIIIFIVYFLATFVTMLIA